jgi:hypothetical protein
MASYTITQVMRVDNYAVAQTLEENEVAVGQQFTISGLTNSSLDGTHICVSTEPYKLVEVTTEGDLVFDWDEWYGPQVIFKDVGDDLDRTVDSGTLTYSTTCTWVDANDLAEWLGIESATANDTAFLTRCAAAANAFAYRRRQASGYFDSLTTVPDASVFEGTCLYGTSLYRERGSVDFIASFDAMGTATPVASLGRVMQLLGTGRPQVG